MVKLALFDAEITGVEGEQGTIKPLSSAYPAGTPTLREGLRPKENSLE